MNLSGRVALITGGSQGIGKTAAIRLAEAGAQVVIVSRSESRLEAVAAAIQKNGGHATAMRADVTSGEDMAQLAVWIGEKFGKLDILVNCAAVALIASLEDTSEEAWDRVVDTNLKGTFLCTKSMLRLLKESDGALIVNLASKVGLSGYRLVSAYAAAKAGVIVFGRSLAQELGRLNIRVVTLCPGPVDTPMRWEATPDIDPSLVIPAESVAETILFLLRIGSRVTVKEIILEAVGYEESRVNMER